MEGLQCLCQGSSGAELSCIGSSLCCASLCCASLSFSCVCFEACDRGFGETLALILGDETHGTRCSHVGCQRDVWP